MDTGTHANGGDCINRIIPTAVSLSICCRVVIFVSIMIQDPKFFFV
jgi:hypothetical protein